MGGKGGNGIPVNSGSGASIGQQGQLNLGSADQGEVARLPASTQGPFGRQPNVQEQIWRRLFEAVRDGGAQSSTRLFMKQQSPGRSVSLVGDPKEQSAGSRAPAKDRMSRSLLWDSENDDGLLGR